MQLYVPLLFGPLQRIAIAFARVAGAARQDKIAWITGAALGYGNDVIDFELLHLSVAPEAPPILSDTHGLNIGLCVGPRQSSFLGSSVGLVYGLVQSRLRSVFHAAFCLLGVVQLRIRAFQYRTLTHGTLGRTQQACRIGGKSCWRLMAVPTWGSVNIGVFTAIFGCESNGILGRFLFGSGPYLSSTEDTVTISDLSRRIMPTGAWIAGRVMDLSNLLGRYPGWVPTAHLCIPGLQSGAMANEASSMSFDVSLSDVSVPARSAIEVEAQSALHGLLPRNQDQRIVSISHRCVQSHLSVRIGDALRTLSRSASVLIGNLFGCNPFGRSEAWSHC